MACAAAGRHDAIAGFLSKGTSLADVRRALEAAPAAERSTRAAGREYDPDAFLQRLKATDAPARILALFGPKITPRVSTTFR